MTLWWSLALIACISYVFRCLTLYWRTVESIHDLPGYRLLLSYNSIWHFILPEIPYVTPGKNDLFRTKHSIFKSFGWDIHSYVQYFSGAKACLVLADASAIKEVTTSRSRFPKPMELYEAIAFFGTNVVASEGEEWKRHRKISAPAFSDRNNKLVWDESMKLTNELFEEVWRNRKVVTVDHAIEITRPLALFIIAIAGFGSDMSWKNYERPPENRKMTFKEALTVVTSDMLLRFIVPDRALRLNKRLRHTATAFDELPKYLSEMISQRQQSEKVERHDLLSKLIEATNDEFEAEKLTESELIGNVFVYLLAGHETTAHTLCFTFALLALYPQEQEILFQQIKSILPDGQLPTYEQMPLFTQSMAVFYESLRLFPPVVEIPKISAEDTMLTTENLEGDKKTIPVPKGTKITISVPGLHYNPRYWKDPDEFKPSRFLEDWPRDAFVPFSAGPRACLGRKFFETEGIAVLTTFISKYKISIKDEPQFANETFEERKARVLHTKQVLTLTPVRVPVVFTRRE